MFFLFMPIVLFFFFLPRAYREKTDKNTHSHVHQIHDDNKIYYRLINEKRWKFIHTKTHKKKKQWRKIETKFMEKFAIVLGSGVPIRVNSVLFSNFIFLELYLCEWQINIHIYLFISIHLFCFFVTYFVIEKTSNK